MSIEAQQNVVSPLAAMKQALEALEDLPPDPKDYIEEAVEILRKAIANLEMKKPAEWLTEERYAQIHGGLQPVWSSGPTNKDYEDAMRLQRLNQLVSPPTEQREWVGLTDEEIRLLKLVCVDLVKEKGWGFLDWNWFARAIEAELKEKNHAT